MKLSRRNFFTLAGASAVGATMISPLEAFYARAARGQVARGIGYGPLEQKLPVNADEIAGILLDGLDLGSTPCLELPPGFNYTVISVTGQKMDDGNRVPGSHDGMAAFAGPENTTILVRNHELNPNPNGAFALPPYVYDQIGGGTTTIVVGPDRRVEKHFVSLAGTIRNCAGGKTPWGSWVSCEENLTLPGSGGATKKHGYNFEVPVTDDIQVAKPVPLVAMGRFNHEAVAVDPDTGWVYQTEDDGNSCFYRFRPHQKGNLRSGGVLEALVIEGMFKVNTGKDFLKYKNTPLPVKWVKIENVDPATNDFTASVRFQAQSQGAAIFSRGEGASYGNGLIYFTCTSGGNVGQGQVFAYKPNNYDPNIGTLTLVVESPDIEVLNFPDNITVAPFGDLFLCEDGSGIEYVVGVNQDGELYRFAANAFNGGGSEFAGACFSPDGHTLFVNIQSPGITCAIWGPWNRKRA
ncbi:alkaline phosphatase PhoX [Nostoc sp. UHCC 0302]|uniref:alkaline phosphatase PhoX n=1 Tax=Nostoc sp. UHCC 0302 TaxID=3134896 RepID=UPI00311C92CE